MKRAAVLKYFNYDKDSRDYTSKDEKYVIAHINNRWLLLGVKENTAKDGCYTDKGEYTSLSDAADAYMFCNILGVK